MARIRTIKPEFPQSETVGKLSRDARLLFIQLWTLVDDEGRARAASRMLASLLYPYDDDAATLMPAWLGELEQHGCIRLYEAEGSRYLEITNWLIHQKIDRPTASRFPAYREGSSIPREPSRSLAADLGPVPRTLDQDLDLLDASKKASAESPKKTSVEKTTPQFDEFWREYPRRDGENPKAPARKLFEALVKSGVDPTVVIAGIRCAKAAHRDKIGTPYIPQAVKWLRDRRFEDYVGQRAAQPPTAPAQLDDAFIEKAILNFERGIPWPRELGSPPGCLDCKAPAAILEKFGYGKQGRVA